MVENLVAMWPILLNTSGWMEVMVMQVVLLVVIVLTIHNTPPWMTAHKEYILLKPCQVKTQWDKNQWRRKKSTVFL